MVDEHLPNGIDQCDTIDSADQVSDRSYQTGGACGVGGVTTLLDYTELSNTHGEWLASAGPSSTGNSANESYAYDAVGRLATVQDTLGGQCTTRQYGYDSDSNRTQYVSTDPGAGGACQTGTLTTIHSYDAADRLTDPGVAYDAMGRVTTLPAADAGGMQETFSYFVNDMVHTITQGTTTHTATMDPESRLMTWATSGDSSATETNHYADDGDSPAWIGENTAGTSWTRNIRGIDGGLAATYTSGSVLTFALSNLHGDVAATADSAGGLTGTSDYQEFGAPRTSTPGRYGWLGSGQREVDTTSGVILMGERIYVPVLGRFLQVDPIAGGNANSYDCVNQDPLTKVDLSGRECTFRKKNPYASTYSGTEGYLPFPSTGLYFRLNIRLDLYNAGQAEGTVNFNGNIWDNGFNAAHMAKFGVVPWYLFHFRATSRDKRSGGRTVLRAGDEISWSAKITPTNPDSNVVYWLFTGHCTL